MGLKPNKHKLFNYVTIKQDLFSVRRTISVPAHRIVRSEGFQKQYEAVKRIALCINNKNKSTNQEKHIQRFVGYVNRITNDEFEIKWNDITNPSNPVEYHIFAMNKLSKVKQRELKVGETVYWDFYRQMNGEIKNQFKFIKPYEPTNKEKEKAMKELANFFNTGDHNANT